MRIKLILIFILIFFTKNNIAVSSENILIDTPKPNAYRVGTTDVVEKKFKVQNRNEARSKNVVKFSKEDLQSFGNLTLKNLSTEIYITLEDEQLAIQEDLQTLWIGAASRSESIKFAIYKLSNPDNSKNDTGILKKIIKPIANMSTLAGIGIGDPIIGTAAIAAGNLLGNASISDSDLNYKYSKVTDADMIVLIGKIDDLQKRLAKNYFDYIRSYEILKHMNKNLENRNKRVEVAAQNFANRGHILVADAYFKSAIDRLENAKSDFLFKRSALEQMVGEKTLLEFEQNLFEREKHN